MCLWLIYSREVQVNIWYFVAVETEEDRKGDIMPILQKRRTADRADLVRQVIAAAVGTVCNELAILAMWATPMRRQRIYLRDVGHRRHKGGSDRTTGAYQIAIVIGFLHELMGNEIEHRKAMPDDWRELLF